MESGERSCTDYIFVCDFAPRFGYRAGTAIEIVIKQIQRTKSKTVITIYLSARSGEKKKKYNSTRSDATRPINNCIGVTAERGGRKKKKRKTAKLLRNVHFGVRIVPTSIVLMCRSNIGVFFFFTVKRSNRIVGLHHPVSMCRTAWYAREKS